MISPQPRSVLLRAIAVLFLLVGIHRIVDAQEHTHFRFALVSDTHIGYASATEDLERTVHDLNEQEDIAFVVISGDITEMGSNAQLILAKSILDSLSEPYHIIPGNHDTKWSESGCTEFARLWGADRFFFEYDGFCFIGCSSGPNMRMGDGHIPPEDMRWVDSVLAHDVKPHQPVIFVNHYPLDAQLDNWYVILDELHRYHTVAVLCGHGHANRAFTVDGIPATMGRSNLRGSKPRGGYNLVELRDDSLFFSERIPGVGTNPPWRIAPLDAPVRKQDTTAPSRPDYSINEQFRDVRLKWKVETGYSIGTTPAVWKNLGIVGNSAGKTTAYSMDDGSIAWSFNTNGTIYSSPAVADGKVVFGSSDGTVYCLEAATGKLVWNLKTASAVVASPTIHRGVVFIGSSDSVFRAIELSSGTIKWTYRGLEGFVETKPLVYDGKIIFGAWDTYLYALDERTGSLLWKWSNGNPGRLYSPAACWPVASFGKIFIVAPDRYMTALDEKTGAIVWRTGSHQVREMIGISEDSSRIYVRLMNDSLLAFSASAQHPELVWASNCNYGYDIDPSMPIEKEGQVMFGTKNGVIYSVQAASGAMTWKYKLGNTIVNTLNPLSSHRLLATTMDGTVALLTVAALHHTP